MTTGERWASPDANGACSIDVLNHLFNADLVKNEATDNCLFYEGVGWITLEEYSTVSQKTSKTHPTPMRKFYPPRFVSKGFANLKVLLVLFFLLRFTDGFSQPACPTLVLRSSVEGPNICSGASVVFSVYFSPGSNLFPALFNWTVNGLPIVNSGPPNTFVWTAPSPGNYTIQVRSAVCPNNPATALLTVSLPQSSLPSAPTAISGSTITCTGTSTDYTIPTVAGLTPVWSLQPVQSVYPNSIPANPAGNPATISWPSTAQGYFLYASYSDGGCTSSAVSIGISNRSGTTPITILSNPTDSFCVNSSFTFTAIGESNDVFTWTLSGGGTKVDNGNSTTVQWTSPSPAGSPFVLTASATNQCNATPRQASKNITVGNANTLVPGSISASNTTFYTGTSQTFSIAPVPGATSYSWSVSPSGPTITGGTTTSASISFGCTPGPYVISVQASNGFCAGSASTINVTANQLSAPGAITIPPTACVNTPVSISVPPVTGANSYSWSGISTSTTNSLSYTFNSAGTYIITAAAVQGSCSSPASPPSTITIQNRPVLSPAVTGPPLVCVGSTVTYSVQNPDPNLTYTWGFNPSLPSANIIGPNTGPSVQVQFTLGAPTALIIATASNSCGSSNQGPGSGKFIWIDNNTPPSITQIDGPTSVCSGSNLYSVASAIPSTFSWSLSGGGSVTSPPAFNNTVARVQWTTPGSYSLSVIQTTACGLTANYSLPVTVTPGTRPIVSLSGNNSVCLNSTQTYTATPAGLTYQWSTSVGNQIQSTVNNTATVTWTNSGGQVISVTPSNAQCQGDLTSYSATVINSSSLTSSLTPPAICSGNTFTYNATSSTVGVTLSWTRAAIVGISQPASSGSCCISEALTNTTTSPIDVTYVYTIISGGCSNTQNVVVTVNPNPAMSSAGTASICSNATLNFPLTSTVPASFTWVAADNANTTGESTSLKTSSTINDVIVNNTALPQTVIYTVTPASIIGGACQGVAQTVVITVNPAPVMTSAASTSVCSGTPLNFPLTGTVPSSFVWTAVDNPNTTGESITSKTSAIINDVLTNNTTSSQSVVYSITPTSTNGACPGASQTFSAIVNALPVVSSPASSLCIGNTMTLSPATGGTWTSSDVTKATVTNSGVVTAISAGSVTFTFTQTSTGCSSSTPSVTINALPVVSAPLTNLCAGNTMTLSPATGGTWASSDITKATVSNAGVVTAIASGSVTFIFTQTSTGCSSSTPSVTINALPVVSAPLSSLCIGNTMTLSPTTGGTWTSSDVTKATVTNAGVVTAVAAGPVTFTFTQTSTGCSNSTPSVTINALPVVSAPLSSLCIGNTMTLSPATGGTWASSDVTKATVSNAGVVTAISAGSVTFTFTQTSTGCSSSTPSVTINALPVVSAPLTNLCTGNTMTLSPTTGGTWASSDVTKATVTNAGGVTAIASGSVTFTFTQTSTGCSSSTPSVTINALPVVSAPVANLCIGATMTLSPTTGGAWASSDVTKATVTNAGVVNAIASGAVTFTFTQTSTGCSSTTPSIVINALPSAVITPSGTTSFCQGGSVTLTAPAGLSYAWSTGATTQAITVSTGANYSVAVTNANNCSATSSATSVTVNPLPAVPTISASGPTAFCVGGSVTLTSSAATNNLWTTGATTQSITVSSLGTYGVTTTNAFGCSQQSNNVSVSVSSVDIQITPAGPVTLCPGTSVNLFANFISANGRLGSGSSARASDQIYWSTGVVGNSINVTGSGTYTASVTSSNGCSASRSVVVNVPYSNDELVISGSLCTTGSVQLTAPVAASYAWNTGASTRSISVNTPGSYTVWIPISGCSISLSTSVFNCTLPPPPPPCDPCSPCGQARIREQLAKGEKAVPCTGAKKINDGDFPNDSDLPSVKEMTVYPNPAVDIITVAVPWYAKEDTQVFMYDMFGKVATTTMLRKGEWKIELSVTNFTDGLYVVRIGNSDLINAVKVVVEHK